LAVTSNSYTINISLEMSGKAQRLARPSQTCRCCLPCTMA